MAFINIISLCTLFYAVSTGAELDYNMWVQAGVIETPLVNIPVVNITTCQPDVWKVSKR